MKIKKVITGIAIVIGIAVLGSLISARYFVDRNELPDSRSITPEIDISDPETASISELMNALAIYRVEEPWEAPDFELASLQGSKGSLREHRGNHVLLTFWTTW